MTHPSAHSSGTACIPRRDPTAPESDSCSLPDKYNIAAAFKGRLIGSWGEYICCVLPILVFSHVCATINFLTRFLRIHPVQSVVNNITQLSGRGFPCIFYMKPFLPQLYVFGYFKMEPRLRNLKIYTCEV